MAVADADRLGKLILSIVEKILEKLKERQRQLEREGLRPTSFAKFKTPTPSGPSSSTWDPKTLEPCDHSEQEELFRAMFDAWQARRRQLEREGLRPTSFANIKTPTPSGPSSSTWDPKTLEPCDHSEQEELFRAMFDACQARRRQLEREGLRPTSFANIKTPTPSGPSSSTWDPKTLEPCDHSEQEELFRAMFDAWQARRRQLEREGLRPTSFANIKTPTPSGPSSSTWDPKTLEPCDHSEQEELFRAMVDACQARRRQLEREGLRPTSFANIKTPTPTPSGPSSSTWDPKTLEPCDQSEQEELFRAIVDALEDRRIQEQDTAITPSMEFLDTPALTENFILLRGERHSNLFDGSPNSNHRGYEAVLRDLQLDPTIVNVRRCCNKWRKLVDTYRRKKTPMSQDIEDMQQPWPYFSSMDRIMMRQLQLTPTEGLDQAASASLPSRAPKSDSLQAHPESRAAEPRKRKLSRCDNIQPQPPEKEKRPKRN